MAGRPPTSYSTFAVAGAAVRYRAVHAAEVEDIVALLDAQAAHFAEYDLPLEQYLLAA